MDILCIRGKNICTPEGIRAGYVMIQNGLISDVAENLSPSLSLEVIDIGDSFLMPGLVDPHVHLNEPGRTNWEGFATGTRAAAAGGITTLVDMPLNCSPVTTTATAVDQKTQAAKGQLLVNCGFWGGVIPGNHTEIEPMINKGVLGFKAFLTHSGIDEFPNVTEEDLHKAMPIIAKYQLPLLVHCELTGNHKHQTTNHKLYQNYLASRPKKWEDDAITLLIRLCEEY